jgi:outer membrane protein OmpA-like peptidoglycan-associated protein
MASQTHQRSQSKDTVSQAPSAPQASPDAGFGSEWACNMQDLLGNQGVVGQVMRATAGGQPPKGDPREAFGKAASAPGQSVPYQAEMESAFGQSFSGVTAHLGQADPMRSMGARAAASGDHVAFASASPDKEVVAHELTHVVQQRAGGGGVQASSLVSSPGDASEREAEHVASAVARGESAPVVAEVSASLSGDWMGDVVNAVGDALDLRTDEERLDAEEELEEFRKKTFAPIDNFVSPAGVGQFRAEFNPSTGQLDIKVRVFFEFIAGDATKVAPGFRPEEFQWNGEEAAWKAQYISAFQTAWSSAGSGVTIRCTKPHWGAMQVSTNVTIEDLGSNVNTPGTGSIGNAHYVVRVSKYPPDAMMITSSVMPPGAHHTSPTAGAYNTAASAPANMAGTTASTVALDSNDTRAEAKTDTAQADIVVPFKKGRSDLDTQGQAAVASAVTEFQNAPDIHARLIGHASNDHAAGVDATQGAIDNMDIARARSSTVESALSGAGVGANRLHVLNVGEQGATADVQWCKVDVDFRSGDTQTPALHEGGHMVGNGDEYTSAGATPAYDAMVQSATGNVLAHADNANQMSVGDNIQPWNYSAFVMALRQITTMPEWQV